MASILIGPTFFIKIKMNLIYNFFRRNFPKKNSISHAPHTVARRVPIYSKTRL